MFSERDTNTVHTGSSQQVLIALHHISKTRSELTAASLQQRLGQTGLLLWASTTRCWSGGSDTAEAVGAQRSVGLHPPLCHPSSTVSESLLWPRPCEFDECSTSALLNRWDWVWEAPASNGCCSTPLAHNHTRAAGGGALNADSPVTWRHTGAEQSYMQSINMSAEMEVVLIE